VPVYSPRPTLATNFYRVSRYGVHCDVGRDRDGRRLSPRKCSTWELASGWRDSNPRPLDPQSFPGRDDGIDRVPRRHVEVGICPACRADGCGPGASVTNL